MINIEEINNNKIAEIVDNEKSTGIKSVKINNELLLKEVNISLEKGCMSNNLYKMLGIMAHRFSLSVQWRGYSWRDELVDEAMLYLTRKWHQFDKSKSTNAFSYYTKIIENAFLKCNERERKQTQIREELTETLGDEEVYPPIGAKKKRRPKKSGRLPYDGKSYIDPNEKPGEVRTLLPSEYPDGV